MVEYLLFRMAIHLFVVIIFFSSIIRLIWSKDKTKRSTYLAGLFISSIYIAIKIMLILVTD